VSKEAKIKAIAPWFGGKRSLALDIIEEAGEHRSWWEPFVGGISIILQKQRCRQECLNDLHRDLTNLAIVIASDRCIDLYDKASRTLYCQDLYDSCLRAVECADFDFAADPAAVTTDQVHRAYCYLALSWMGRNGAAGTARINYQFTMRYTNNGGDSATRWQQVAESIPEWHRRLVGVVISRKDGIELLSKIEDAPGTVIYLDPPYFSEGGAYEHTFSSTGGGMFGGDDHAMLAEEAARFKQARVIVSYYDHPRIDHLYPGWTKRRIDARKMLAAQNKRGANRAEAPEVLIINGPSYAKGV
jgi:DNA adenine methylase